MAKVKRQGIFDFFGGGIGDGVDGGFDNDNKGFILFLIFVLLFFGLND